MRRGNLSHHWKVCIFTGHTCNYGFINPFYLGCKVLKLRIVASTFKSDIVRTGLLSACRALCLELAYWYLLTPSPPGHLFVCLVVLEFTRIVLYQCYITGTTLHNTFMIRLLPVLNRFLLWLYVLTAYERLLHNRYRQLNRLHTEEIGVW